MKQWRRRLTLVIGIISCAMLSAAVPHTSGPDLKNHHPRIAATQQNTLTVWAFRSGGLAQQRFGQNGGWSAWQSFGLPSDGIPWSDFVADPSKLDKLGPSVPMTGGQGGLGALAAGLFAYPARDGTQRIAVLVAQASGSSPVPYTWKTVGLPSSISDLRPETLIADSDLGFTAYGSVSARKGSVSTPNPLLEVQARWSTDVPPAPSDINVTITNHGRPKVAGKDLNVVLGPNSAVGVPLMVQGSSNRALHQFVFFKATDGNADRVMYLRKDGQNQARFVDLGLPPGAGEIVEGPVAYYYDTPNGVNMSVFVVARADESSRDRRYKLFERFWQWTNGSTASTVDESWLPDWRAGHGAPIKADGSFLLAQDTKFRLTAAMVWRLASTLRINLSGWADGRGQDVKQPVAHYWDGAQWLWGGAPRAVPSKVPHPRESVESSSAAVIDTPSYKRFSVLYREARTSVIWEYYYWIENGQWSGWYWHRLP